MQLAHSSPFYRSICFFFAAGLTCVLQQDAANSADSHPNVLFIAVDDLRPELNCYGRQHIHSPNIDRLASEGVLFERSYCMVPTCGASRAALMTSVRPSKNRFVSYLAWAEKETPAAIPLHRHFKDSGYHTVSLGKIFHHKTDHANGWSEPAWRSNKNGYRDLNAMQEDIRKSREQYPKKRKHRGAAFESFDADDNEYPDGHCASKAVDYLEQFAANPEDKPFFLAVGFLKPHLPFCAPKKYWDFYDRAEIDVPDNYRIPKDVPKEAPHNSGELRAYAGIHPNKMVDRETARSLIHGYYACVSFTDAQVGRLLDSLEKTGLDENTIVVLWGDHGWQLGEHGMWNKHSCFETSLHSPLIMRVPGKSSVAAGTRVPALVEFIDVYPTLCELAELPVPSHVEGASLLPLMKDPTGPGKGYAISRFQKGDSIRNANFRYSEYTSGKDEFLGAMLFDHGSDPGENRNLYPDRKDTSDELAEKLHAKMGRDTK